MFFNNALIYSFKQKPNYNFNEMEKALAQDAFTPCLTQDLSKLGWAKPLGKHGDSLIEHRERRILLCMKRQDKVLPAAAINELLTEQVEQIQLEEGRKVNRKEREELKENIVQSLLPNAVTTSKLLHGFIDLDAQLIVVNTAAHTRAEEFLALLRKSLGTLPVLPAFTSVDIPLHLTNWLKEQAVCEQLSIGLNAELVQPDDSAAVVKIKSQDLSTDEVRAHLDAGNQVKGLALNFDEQVSVYLCDSGTIKSMRFADALVQENADIPNEDMAHKLMADFILSSSTLVAMFTVLMGQLDNASRKVA